jgi:hypothetical protein
MNTARDRILFLADRNPRNGTSSLESDIALEPHYSIQEVAEIWGLCENSVRELFKNEPGVVKLERPRPRHKRRYITVRIPLSVLERVHRRMSSVV